MDARTGYAIHYDPLCEAGPVGAPWTGEPETVGGCDECFELVAEDLVDNNEYQGQCFHCRREIKARGRGRVAQGGPSAMSALRQSGVVAEKKEFPQRRHHPVVGWRSGVCLEEGQDHDTE